MEQYIGTKMVQAEPCIGVKKDPVTGDVIMQDGYRVVYQDGYESWSPKEVFEEAYRPTDGMSFGLAIEAAKKGKKIARRGWNGKGQYVELASNISYIAPDSSIMNPNHEAIGNKALAFCGTSGVQLGWLASQADMLADDWEIVE